MDALHIVMAAVPIAVLLLALGVFKLPAHWATLGVLLITAVIAMTVWGMSPVEAATAGAEGGATALWPIMLVIIAAIFTYNVAVATGSLDVIKRMLVSISPDRRIQVLILAWGFGGFLEAVAGYGTAVAIPASILAILGFNPVFAAVISLIANTVPTAFGAVGIPVSTLAQITGLDVAPLSLAVGLQLAPFILIIPFALVMMTGREPVSGETRVRHGFAALKGVVGITFASGMAFALPQLLAAAFLGAELPALLGSLCSMIVTILMARQRSARQARTGQTKTERVGQPSEEADIGTGFAVSPVKPVAADVIGFRQGLLAWLPYILIFAFIIVSSPLVPPVYHSLSDVASSFVIFTGEGAKATAFKWIATPGVLIILAAILGGAIQGMRPAEMLRTFFKTVWKLRQSTVTVVCILAMAKIMGYSGMIADIADFLVAVAGPVYPLIASLLGTLGTFVTGSDTSSNILFGNLQVEVAGRIGADPYWLAAANTAGATAGKMISPQSIAVATSATGLTGKEGEILSKTILFCLGYVVLLGLMVWALSGIMRFG